MTETRALQRLPLVSVVMACYNGERHLRRTLDAILAQTYPNVEVTVADDGSTDGSADVLRSYGERVRWETAPRRGQGAAVNRAFAMSRGEFVNFHDADDSLAPDKIERQVAVALAEPGAVVYGPWRLVWTDGERIARVEERQTQRLPEGADALEMHLRGWFCPAHAYLWPRGVVEDLGGWDESLWADKDADFAMRAIIAGARLVYCPNAWADYVQHGGERASVSRSARALRSRARVARKVTGLLEDRGDLDRYRDAVAWRYDDYVRDHWNTCRATAAWCAREARRISGRPPAVGRWYYRMAYRASGVACAERLASLKRRVAGGTP